MIKSNRTDSKASLCPACDFLPNRKEDLKQIARYIAQDKPVAARQWVAKIKQKCHLLAKCPKLGDARLELGEGIRSSYVGSYVIYFRKADGFIDIVRVIRGDRDTQRL